MKSKILTGIAALVLLCAASAPVMAAKAKAGSVDPPASGAAAGASSATSESTEGTASTEATPKKVKKAKRRHHRYWGHRYGYFPFFIPPPRYWFRPWPRYRYYRHHRYRQHWGFPFFFRW